MVVNHATRYPIVDAHEQRYSSRKSLGRIRSTTDLEVDYSSIESVGGRASFEIAGGCNCFLQKPFQSCDPKQLKG